MPTLMSSTGFITGHVIYNPAYTYKFKLKTTLIYSFIFKKKTDVICGCSPTQNWDIFIFLKIKSQNRKCDTLRNVITFNCVVHIVHSPQILLVHCTFYLLRILYTYRLMRKKCDNYNIVVTFFAHTLQSLTGKLQGRISTQGDPCSHYREWVYRVQLSSVLVTFFSLF